MLFCPVCVAPRAMVIKESAMSREARCWLGGNCLGRCVCGRFAAVIFCVPFIKVQLPLTGHLQAPQVERGGHRSQKGRFVFKSHSTRIANIFGICKTSGSVEFCYGAVPVGGMGGRLWIVLRGWILVDTGYWILVSPFTVSVSLLR
jgi:hypothetical protein